MKKCVKCELDLPLEMFSKRSKSKDGLMYSCKACQKLYQLANREAIKQNRTEYYNNNKESILEGKLKYYEEKSSEIKSKRKDYYIKNRDKCNNETKLYKIKNPDKIRELSKNYYESNKDTLRVKKSIYQRENPHIFNALSAKRRAMKLNATPNWANLDKVSEFYKEAKERTETESTQYHVHHVIPLISKEVCGLHCEANLSVVTAEENLRLGNRHWPDMWS